MDESILRDDCDYKDSMNVRFSSNEFLINIRNAF